MLEIPPPSNPNLCPACKLWPCCVCLRVWKCVCVCLARLLYWLFRIAHSASQLSSLFFWSRRLWIELEVSQYSLLPSLRKGLSHHSLHLPPFFFFFSFFLFFITVLHCKMYSSIRRHQYTSAFKYVKLQRGHRCNTVPGSQITICGGLVFLLITPCEMMSFVLLHHLILCILTLLCISFSLPQKRSFDTHIY